MRFSRKIHMKLPFFSTMLPFKKALKGKKWEGATCWEDMAQGSSRTYANLVAPAQEASALVAEAFQTCSRGLHGGRELHGSLRSGACRLTWVRRLFECNCQAQSAAASTLHGWTDRALLIEHLRGWTKSQHRWAYSSLLAFCLSGEALPGLLQQSFDGVIVVLNHVAHGGHLIVHLLVHPLGVWGFQLASGVAPSHRLLLCKYGPVESLFFFSTISQVSGRIWQSFPSKQWLLNHPRSFWKLADPMNFLKCPTLYELPSMSYEFRKKNIRIPLNILWSP